MNQIVFRVVLTRKNQKGEVVTSALVNPNAAMGAFRTHADKQYDCDAKVELQVYSRSSRRWVTIECHEIKVPTVKYALLDTKTGLYLSKYAALASNIHADRWKVIAISINGCKHVVPPMFVKSASEAKIFDSVEACTEFNKLFRRTKGHYLHRVEL